MITTAIGIIFIFFLLFTTLKFSLIKEFYRCTYSEAIAKPYTKIKSKQFKQTLQKNIKIITIRNLVQKNFVVVSRLYTLITLIIFVLLIIQSNTQYTNAHIYVFDNTQEKKFETTPLSLQYIPENTPFLGSENANVVVLEVGCYTCTNTQQLLPILRELRITQQNILYYYIPNPTYEKELAALTYCVYLAAPQHYWQVHTQLIEYELFRQDPYLLFTSLGVSVEDITLCMDSGLSEAFVIASEMFIQHHNIKSQSALFISDKVIIGVGTSEDLYKIIKKASK